MNILIVSADSILPSIAVGLGFSFSSNENSTWQYLPFDRNFHL